MVELGIAGIVDAVEIGRGGFAVVYRALQVDFQREVAVKVLTGAHLDDRNRERFDRERRALGTLSSHPNIVPVYSAGYTDAGYAYLLMPYLTAGSLQDRLDREGRLPWQDVVRIGIKVAGALDAAHRADVLHRDIKPANILTSPYGEPMLADFGIAQVEGMRTQTASVTASIAHAAPELLSGRPPSVSSDVYALGSTMYALLTGLPAFSRITDDSIVAVFGRIATEPVPDLRWTGVPSGLAAVIERSMAKDPGQRYPSAAAMAEALAAVDPSAAAGWAGTGAGPATAAAAYPGGPPFGESAGGATPQPPQQPPPSYEIPTQAVMPVPGPVPQTPPSVFQPEGYGSAGPYDDGRYDDRGYDDELQAPAGPDRSGQVRRQARVLVTIGVVLLALALVLTAVAVIGGNDGGGTVTASPVKGNGQVLVLEPAAATGDDPFTTDVTKSGGTRFAKAASSDFGGTGTKTSGHVSLTPVVGTTPGLYGGTQSIGSCDVEQMIAFLQADPAKGAAWAAVQGIAVAELPDYLRGLTPVVLRVDTRVTNHGYAGGRATPRQSVLEAGTAVLVDAQGVPRAKCACGNPLLAPEPIDAGAPTSGETWPGYAQEQVAVVVAGEPVDALVLSAPDESQFSRPVGTEGEADVIVPPVDTTTTTTVPVTTTTALGTASSAPAPRGPDLDVELSWTSPADLDLVVVDPAGNVVAFDRPTAPGGGLLDRDANASCIPTASSNSPIERVVWPVNGAPSGTYQVRVVYYATCPGGSGPQGFTIRIRQNGIVVFDENRTIDPNSTLDVTRTVVT
jgi:Protein kinase domain